MKKYLIIACFICLSPFFVTAQNLNGFWKGTFIMNRGCFPVNNIELQITISGDSMYGQSYHYLDVNNYVKKIFKGSYNATLKKLLYKKKQ